jgi:hypothetical protein
MSDAFLTNLFTLAAKLTAAEPRLRLANNEADKSADKDSEAAHCLKLDESRIGRDLELYNFMALIQGEAVILADVFQEVVLPLKGNAPSAFSAGVAFLKDQKDVFDLAKRPGASGAEWLRLLDELSA